MNKDIQIKVNNFYFDLLREISPLESQTMLQKFIDGLPSMVKVVNKEYSKPFQIQAVPPTSEPLKIKQKVIINTYYGPWHNTTGFVVEALGKGMYKVSVTNLGTTRVLSFHRSELTEITT